MTKPATPLPFGYEIDQGWINIISGSDEHFQYVVNTTGVENEQDAQYIVTACNAFPELVEALEACFECITSGDIGNCPPCIGSMAPFEHAAGLAERALAKVRPSEPFKSPRKQPSKPIGPVGDPETKELMQRELAK